MKTMKILVTAGPTRESIDPVRFISNHSTGAMGYAIAGAAQARGHKAILVTGPTHLLPPKKVKVIRATTAEDMFKAVKAQGKGVDCVIMAAAVSDFRPALYRTKKLKRAHAPGVISLKQNPDILAWLGSRKTKPLLVGFCMETEALARNAQKKLLAKNLDMVVANKISVNKTPFGTGRTSVIIIDKEKKARSLKSVTKEKVAAVLLDKIEKLWYKD